MRCWELIEDGQWPLSTNQRPGGMMTDQSEAQSDDEDAFWWRVNIGVICYWAAHWLCAVRAAVSLLQCCRHRLMSPACAACCSPHDHCGTLINTHRPWWTRNICSEMRGFDAGSMCLKTSAWRQHRHRCSGLTSNGDTERRVWLILLGLNTFDWETGKRNNDYLLPEIHSRAGGTLVLIDFILSWYFWRMKTLFVSRSNLISHLRCWV